MKILSLTLKNFKGIRNFVLDTQGGNVDVFGDNATGKTTIFDAFTWLLFDKDSQNKKDFEIKTLGPNGKPAHGLDHEVEAMLEIGGRQITLRKVFREKWTKKRGSATAEFTGHTTDYFVDGVPVKKGEYEARIAEIADESIFKLLTNPAYFNEQLHWQERRKILLEVCGDISDQEVIASDKSLFKLPDILQGRKLEDHRKVIAARRAEINKELEKIPVRIDEVQRNLPDISSLIPDKLPEDIAKLKACLKEKQETLLQLESGGEVAQKKNELAQVEAELLQIRNEYQTGVESRLKEKRVALNEVQLKIDYQLNRRIVELNNTVSANNKKIETLEAKAAQLRAKWQEVNAQQFEFEQDSVCPACGQDIPKEKLAEARATAEAAFNREKAEKLAAISTEGKTIMAEVAELERQNTELQKQIDELKSQQAIAETEAEILRKEIEDIRTQNILENHPEYIQKLQEKANLESTIALLHEGKSGAVAEVRREIEQVEGAISALEQAQTDVRRHEEGLKRIEELKAQEKQLAAEFAKLEEELYLTEQFIRTKVSLLEEKINSKFKMTRFKLFDTQINGGVVECCETLYNGVPYSGGLNNAARINVGLDIINTLSEHYGFEAPIFVDNAEAVTKLIETKGQVIRLVVSEQDKKLRVECENVMREAV